ncbi:hypothetical protein ACFQ3Z_04550 [Streptomyces nogalater]
MLVHFIGSRAEALAELERRARSYSPEHPRFPKRRRLLRDGDGFLLVVDGAMQSFLTRFTVAELLEDSDAPVGNSGAPVANRAVTATSMAPGAPETMTGEVERYDDGVPVKPPGWGAATCRKRAVGLP